MVVVSVTQPQIAEGQQGDRGRHWPASPDSLFVRVPPTVVVQSVWVAEPERTVLAGAVLVLVL